MKKFTILIPVYNDWKSLQILLEDIDLQLKKFDDQFDVVILNDFSTQKCDISVEKFSNVTGKTLSSWELTLYVLPCSLSHPLKLISSGKQS